MEIKYSIRQLQRNTSDGGVIDAHWQAVAIEDKYNASTYGCVSFEPDSSDNNFIPFEDLTEEVVIQWVKDKLGEEYITTLEQGLAAQIEDQKAPKVASGLPW
jgi:hypothetical protein